jgi:glycosyltransferase involved in cell wall biosynthesis
MNSEPKNIPFQKKNSERLPTLSVIVPSYNQAEFIPQCLDSILSQNYPSVEVIVIDGQSTDETLEILKNYGNKIRWISEPDKGQADALNKGIRMASGEIIGWLNSDDRYESGALLAVGRFFASHPDILWAFGYSSIINEKSQEIRKFITQYKNARVKHYSYRSLLEENFISQMSVFIRREALARVGGADASLRYAMDYDLWLRLGKHFQPGFIPQRLGQFRIHGATKSITGFREQFREDFSVARRYAEGFWWPLVLHYLNNVKIVAIYKLLALWQWLFKR